MDTELKEKLEALRTYREYAIRYVEMKIGWEEFWEKFAEIMGPFDPLDLALVDLDKDQRKEVLFYVKWHGGEFGESEDKIPKRSNWEYGKSIEPYSWIDTHTYYKEFSSAFIKLREEIGI